MVQVNQYTKLVDAPIGDINIKRQANTLERTSPLLILVSFVAATIFNSN